MGAVKIRIVRLTCRPHGPATPDPPRAGEERRTSLEGETTSASTLPLRLRKPPLLSSSGSTKQRAKAATITFVSPSTLRTRFSAAFFLLRPPSAPSSAMERRTAAKRARTASGFCRTACRNAEVLHRIAGGFTKQFGISPPHFWRKRPHCGRLVGALLHYFLHSSDFLRAMRRPTGRNAADVCRTAAAKSAALPRPP